MDRAFLIGSAAMFGSISPAAKLMFMTPGPPTASALSFLRGGLGALLLLPQLLPGPVPADGGEREALTPRCVRASMELAVYNFAYNALLFVGLELGGSAMKSAFLLQGTVVFTPLMLALSGAAVSPRSWALSAMALCGVGFIALDPAEIAASANGLPISSADALFVGSALAWSCIVFRLAAFSKDPELARNTVRIQALKNVALTGIYGAWAAFDVSHLPGGLAAAWPGYREPTAWAILAASAVTGGMLGDLLQALGQRSVRATEATVLLSTEPLWAAVISFVLLHEKLCAREWVGGAILVAAAVLVTLDGSDEAAAVHAAPSPPQEGARKRLRGGVEHGARRTHGDGHR